MCWVIVRSHGLYTVGFFSPRDEWFPHKDFDSSDGAARYLHWLNGGDSNPYDEEPDGA